MVHKLLSIALRFCGHDFANTYGPQLIRTASERFDSNRLRHGRLVAWIELGRDFIDLLAGGLGERTKHLFKTGGPLPRGQKGRPMKGFRQDVVFSLRNLRAHKGFTAIVTLVLAFGIGATTSMFSVLKGVILSQLPYEDPDALVIVFETDRFNDSFREAASGPDYADWLEAQTVFQSMAAWTGNNPTINDELSNATRLNRQLVTQNFFATLGWAPTLGRDFLPSEAVPGAPHVAVISDGLWKRRFGSDVATVGATILLDGVEHMVVGIMPPGFAFGDNVDVWSPITSDLATGTRGMHGYNVIGRLADGVSVQEAGIQIGAIMANLEEQYPDDNVGRGANVVPLAEVFVGGVRPALMILMAAVTLVLLITCANVSNLLFARATARQREFALRAAIGASRMRLIRQMMTESIVLAALGGVGGVIIAKASMPLLRSLTSLPRIDTVTIDPGVLGFSALVTLGTGVLFGLLPALRTSNPDLNESLGDGGRSVAGVRGTLRNVLTTAQIALAFVLVVGAGLVVVSGKNLSTVDPGFRAEGLGRLSISLPASRYPNSFWNWPNVVETQRFFRSALERIEALPGVSGVALAANHPVSEGFTTRVTVEGGPQTVEEGVEESRIRPVSYQYFETAGIPVITGRQFNQFDAAESPLVVMVNRAFEQRYFPEGATGKTVSFWGGDRTIVGVVGDTKFMRVDSPTPPAVYPPMFQIPFGTFDVIVHSSNDIGSTLLLVRQEIAAIDPLLAVDNLESFESILKTMLAPQRFTAIMFALFGLLALSLAVVGIYGVISYGVNQRTREFGIRMSLGAEPARVRQLVASQGLRLGLAGIAVGGLTALLLTRFLESILFGVSALNPMVLGSVALALTGTAVLASLVPAVRASKTNPMIAIQTGESSSN